MIKIRKGTLSDLNEVVALSMQARNYHNKILGDYFNTTNTDFEHRFMMAAINDEDKTLLVAEQNGKVVGMLVAIFKSAPWIAKSNICQVENVCVDENIRRQGVGRMMFAELKSECIQRKVDYLNLGVYCQNTNAIPFYESLGFKPLSIKMSMEINGKS